jgi:transposase
VFALSPGHEHDAPHGRALLEELGPMPEGLPLLMDRAYEGDATRQLVLDLGMIPVVPPKCNRLQPWEYDRALYKKRNEIERLFRRLKRLPPHILPLRKTRRRLSRVPLLCAHRRSTADSVNTP